MWSAIFVEKAKETAHTHTHISMTKMKQCGNCISRHLKCNACPGAVADSPSLPSPCCVPMIKVISMSICILNWLFLLAAFYSFVDTAVSRDCLQSSLFLGNFSLSLSYSVATISLAAISLAAHCAKLLPDKCARGKYTQEDSDGDPMTTSYYLLLVSSRHHGTAKRERERESSRVKEKRRGRHKKRQRTRRREREREERKKTLLKSRGHDKLHPLLCHCVR